MQQSDSGAVYTKQQLAVYERLVHPPEQQIDELSSAVAATIDARFTGDKPIRILDLGIGGGWISLRILRCLMDRKRSFQVCGVDSSLDALDLCAKRITDDLGLAESSSTLGTVMLKDASGDHRIELRHEGAVQQLEQQTANGLQYDACFAFLLLNHMGGDWRLVLDHAKRLVGTKGLIVLSEIAGDLAAWNYNFDKVDLLRDTDQTRLRTLGFIRQHRRDCEQLGWHPRNAVSSSDISPAVSYLIHSGFRRLTTTSPLTKQYKAKWTIGDWLKAADYDNGGQEKVFSIFPTLKPGSPEHRRMKDFVESGLKRFDLDETSAIEASDELSLYLFVRRVDSKVDDQTRESIEFASRPDPHVGALLRARFAELRATENQEIQRYTWQNDLVSLWQSGVIESPSAIMLLGWDMKAQTWNKDTPILAKKTSDFSPVCGLARYFSAVEKFATLHGTEVGNYVSNTIFRHFPERVLIHTVHDSPSFRVTPELNPDGHVFLLRIEIPNDLLNVQPVADADLRKHARQLTNLNGDVRLRDTFLFTANDLRPLQDKISSMLKPNLGCESVFNREGYLKALEELRRVLSALTTFTHQKGWLLGEDSHPNSIESPRLRYFLKALILSGLTGAKQIWHIPSRDVALSDSEDDQNELSAGGLIIFIDSANGRTDPRLLQGCLHLRNRAAYLREYREQLLEKASIAAKTAIIARNMSHNIGSHVIAGITPDDVRSGAEDYAHLMGYLQQRMDFVARVATEWPVWREPSMFAADVLKPFMDQKLLLDKIASDHNYNRKRIRFFLKTPDSNSWFRFAPTSGPKDKDFYADWSQCGPPSGEGPDQPFADFTVAIPGGSVGRQAFYGLLENLIRNAAKHNQMASTCDLFFEITEIRRPGRRSTYDVVISDSLSSNSNGLVDAIADKLNQSLIDSATGELNRENWGLHEMQAYAEFLGFHGGSPDFRLGPALEARAVQTPTLTVFQGGDTGRKGNHRHGTYLGYRLRLQKVVRACLLSAQPIEVVSDSIKSFILSKEDGSDRELFMEISAVSPALICFVAVDIDDLKAAGRFVNRFDRRLPYRLMISVDDSLKEEARSILGHRVFITDCLQQGPIDDVWVVSLAMYLTVIPYLTRVQCKRVSLLLSLKRSQPGELHRWDELSARVMSGPLSEILELFRVAIGDQGLPMKSALTLDGKRVVIAQGTPQLIAPKDDLTRAWLVFDNHGALRSRGCFAYDHVYYQDVSSNNSRTTVDYLFHPPKGVAADWYLLRTIEACFAKVVIADERVAQYCSIAREDSLNYHPLKIKSLHQAGIRPIGYIRIDDDPAICLVPIHPQEASEWRLDGIEVNTKKGTITPTNTLTTAPYSPDEHGLFADMLVIHWQIIEDIARRRGPAVRDSVLQALSSVFRRVIITSGRGAPRQAPLNTFPFVEYSVVDNYVVKQLCKISLVSVLTSTVAYEYKNTSQSIDNSE